MSGIKIANGTAASAEMVVDTNGSAQVTGPLDEALAGFQIVAVENDSGSVTGSRLMNTLEVTEDYRLRVGVDQVLFSDWFPGAAVNSGTWVTLLTTMTVTQASGYATLNAGGSVASGAVARLVTWRSYPLLGTAGLSIRMRIQMPFAPVTGNVTEWGAFIASGTTAPTDGVFFRYNALGEFRAIICVNGVESPSAVLSNALIGTATTRYCAIDVSSHGALFWIDDVLVAELASTGVGPMGSINVPVCVRCYNSSATAAAQAPKVAFAAVTQADVAAGLSARELAAGSGNHASQGPTGGTMGQTATWVNAAAPAAIVPTNTTAALGAAPGGIYLETATLAAGTDGIIASYQVPAGTAALPGRSLVITGVTVSSSVHTAVTGGGCARGWAIAYGHTAVSLLTAEALASGTKAPRRVPLGVQGVTAAVAAGVDLKTVGGRLNTPIYVNAGEFVAVVVKSVGTAITAGAFLHTVQIDGYWQ